MARRTRSKTQRRTRSKTQRRTRSKTQRRTRSKTQYGGRKKFAVGKGKLIMISNDKGLSCGPNGCIFGTMPGVAHAPPPSSDTSGDTGEA